MGGSQMKRLNNKKGFTLLELIVVIAIIGMVITTIFSLLFIGYDVYGKASDDFQIQSDVRLAMEEINTTVRSSKAVFAVPDVSYKDAQWNYLGMNEEKTKIIDYQWDPITKKHIEKVMVGPYDGVTFEIKFDKVNSMSKDNSLKMYFEAYTNGKTSQRFDVMTGYEALNSLQVINYGTESKPATALAYRADEFHYENMKIYVNIALILDTSGSMNDTVGGSSTNNKSLRRIAILKEKTNLLIEEFATNTNPDVIINMALVEFNSNANALKSFKNVKTQKATLKSDVDAMCGGSNQSCSGGTNTGDGLRRGFYALETLKASQLAANNNALEEIVIKNYIIQLSDGVYTYYTENVASTTSTIEEVCTRTNWWGTCTRWENQTIITPNYDYYLGQGNVSTSYTKNNIGTRIGIPYTTGFGNKEDPSGLEYIRQVSAMGLDNQENYTNYIIGFSNDVTGGVMEKIRVATNTHESRVFSAADADELGLTFTNIQMSITNDTWHYLGPKLVGGN